MKWLGRTELREVLRLPEPCLAIRVVPIDAVGNGTELGAWKHGHETYTQMG